MTSASAAPTGPRRVTRQREAITALLSRTDAFVSAQDLHARLRDAGQRIGLATVYRTLQAMEAEGAVDLRRTDEGEALYRQCETDQHHHHLVCRSCGRAVEISGAGMERWLHGVVEQHGFVDVDHTVEVTGTCRECAAAS